jgi:hypothetical protein
MKTVISVDAAQGAMMLDRSPSVAIPLGCYIDDEETKKVAVEVVLYYSVLVLKGLFPATRFAAKLEFVHLTSC